MKVSEEERAVLGEEHGSVPVLLHNNTVILAQLRGGRHVSFTGAQLRKHHNRHLEAPYDPQIDRRVRHDVGDRQQH